MMTKALRLLFAKQRVSRNKKGVIVLKKRKRKETEQGKANTKKGKIMEISNVDERAVDDVDRISELPEHILHHILCLLRWPQDIARTSVLSKKWKVIWESLTFFDFDQSRFKCGKGEIDWSHLQPLPVEQQSAVYKQMFEEYSYMYEHMPMYRDFILFVENTLATRLEPLPSIEKFKLSVSQFIPAFLDPFMNHWISAATDKNVKELEIHMNKGSKSYMLPQVVYSSGTITSLKLHHCGVDASDVIKLQNLRKLSMKAMRINENMVNKFVQGCPLIEDMRLIKCHGLKFLHISTLPKLNRLEVHEGSSLRSIKLEAPNLETFWFYGKKSSRCKILLAGSGNLKNLTLKHAHMADKSFHERISYFPLLEKLFLLECHALQRFTILSDKLKGLSVIRCNKLKEANIDAPNLLSFEYTGAELPFSSMNPSRLQEVKLHLKSQKHNFHPPEVLKFIQGFDAKGFSLFFASNQDVNMYEELKGIHLIPSGVFKIEVTKSARILGNLLNSHLRDFRPKFLTFKTSSPTSDLVVFIRELLMNREKTPSCCKYYSKKCWLHYLEDVTIVEFSRASCLRNPNVQFELKWRNSPQPEDI